MLSVTQLLSWGALYYTFAVVAPFVADDTGWSTTAVSAVYSAGLLVSGLAAPAVATALACHGPRRTMTAGSLVGTVGMVMWAAAPSVPVLVLSWLIIGSAMAATLYEPAIATLVGIDPTRSRASIVAVTTLGGLASTVFGPLAYRLTDDFGWRFTVAALGMAAGGAAAALHALLPRSLPVPERNDKPAGTAPAPTPVRLRNGLVAEQLAHVTTTAFLVAFLMSQGTDGSSAATALAALGVGKLAGRLTLAAPTGAVSPQHLAVSAATVQLAALLAMTWHHDTTMLYALAALTGAGSGMTTVLRPLMTVGAVGVPAFAAVSARLQRAAVFGRAAGPMIFGAGTQLVGWRPAWAAIVLVFGVAAVSYRRAEGDAEAP